MEFKSIMHITFFTEQMDVMRDFYENKLGLKPKIVTKAKAYKNKGNALYQQIAKSDPEKVLIVYIEIAPGQFIELFPSFESQGPHAEWNQNIGYSHYALLVDDIFKTRDELIARGVEIDTKISMGPSETYQMWVHDPDGNKFEIMQYTENSYQVAGNIM